jgi:universal stress protein A
MKIRPSVKAGEVVVEVRDRDEPLLAAGAATSPFQIGKILVPVDFSECSKKALQYAVPFARQCHASIFLLNVVRIVYPTGELGTVAPPVSEAESTEASGAALDQLARAAIGEQVPTAKLVRVGLAAEEIVQAARELGIDLIILSTHGHTGLKHVLLGSTAEQVVRRAPCPVLTVREHEHDFVAPG